MKRKVGDMVTVKSFEWWSTQPKNEHGNIERDESYFTKDMAKFCGKTVKIKTVFNNGLYSIETIEGISSSFCNWKDWMFEDTDKNFDYYEFTPQNLRKLVWGGNGEVIDQNDKILNLYPTFVIGEALLKDNSIFSAVGPFKIRVPKEKKEVVSAHQFKPFEKVLVRDIDSDEWQCNFFDCFFNDEDGYNYSCVANSWKQCIPYEGNENLVGRTENPPSLKE